MSLLFLLYNQSSTTSISLSEVSLVGTKMATEIVAPHRCLEGKMHLVWSMRHLAGSRNNRAKGEQKYTLGESKIGEIRKRINYFKDEIKDKWKLWQLQRRRQKVIKKKPKWHIRRRRQFFCWSCVAVASRAEAGDGKKSKAGYWVMGNTLPGWHSLCEEPHSSSAFPPVWSLKNSAKVNICSCRSSAMSLELIHFLTFYQLLAWNGRSSLWARLGFKGKVPEVTNCSLIHCNALVLEELF